MVNTATTLTDRMRGALRMTSKSTAIELEINDCIAACKLDLKNAGINSISEEDPLIIRAITLYVKAEFGYNDKAAQFKESYESLKLSLALAGDYNTATPAE